MLSSCSVATMELGEDMPLGEDTAKEQTVQRP